MNSKLYSRRLFCQLGIGFTLSVAIAACNTPSEPEQTEAAPLKVGLNVGNVPWEYEDEAGELVGFEVDLIEAIATALDREIEFIDMPFIDLFPALLSERIDVAIASITITEERLETLDFAQPYYDSDQSLTVRSDSEIERLEDMAGKVVAVDNGSTGDQWVTENQDRYQFAEIVRYEGLNPAMEDLAAGAFDGYISDLPATTYYVQDHDDLAVVERIPTGEQYSMMFAKGNPLRDQCNEVISTLKQDNTLAAIHEKWFGVAPDPDTSTVVVKPVPE
ncbi:ABC transporter substrate-binding protein [Spirulina major]|uniref:ABC transporter substrate-binding protein n=1 Tax=Spirulina major TaxID=270636 RepID=UPI000A02AD94|nr:ABC transporter substrate-binding protein [Spirulina major]